MFYPDLNAYDVIMLVDELHKQGYEQLRILPGMAPHGLSWRWALYPKVLMTDNNFELYGDCTPFKSIYGSTNDGRPVKSSNPSIQDQCTEFFSLAKGSDKDYVSWFQDIVQHAQKGIYPTAYWDGFSGWEFLNGEKLAPPPFHQVDLNGLNDDAIINYALYAFDKDSSNELRYVLNFKGIRPERAEMADTVRQAIAENKCLVTHYDSAQYKIMDYDCNEILSKKEIENGLLVTFKDGREIELIDEVIFAAWGKRKVQQPL